MNHISIDNLIEFRTERRIKTRIILTETMSSEILCYEPGQGTAEHHHVKEDEAFFVLEGEGTITVDDDKHDVAAHSLVFAPVGSKHGLQADKGSRFVVMYFRSPGRKAKKEGLVVATEDDQAAE